MKPNKVAIKREIARRKKEELKRLEAKKKIPTSLPDYEGIAKRDLMDYQLAVSLEIDSDFCFQTSRQVGKSHVLAFKAVFTAVFYKDVLGLEGAGIFYLAKSRYQAMGILWQTVWNIVDRYKLHGYISSTNKTTGTIYFHNGNYMCVS